MACLMFSSSMTLADDSVKEASEPLRSQKVRAACSAIADNIKRGVNIRKFVKTSILMGLPACPLIICSLESKGDPGQVLTGAIDAGTGPDVVSRCALLAGVAAGDIAAILTGASTPGVCYMTYVMPEKPEVLVKPDIPVISPSKF